MSPVIGNIGSTGASVAITKGYSVANSAYVCVFVKVCLS